jgi:hypothetical protein
MKVAQFAAELADREAIRDVLARYARGIDRVDADLLRSTFWDDAVDDHGTFSGSARAFIDQLIPKLNRAEALMHFLGNILIEIRGDVAAVETYLRAFHRQEFADGQRYELIIGGRYVDRMEKRDDEWRIARRKVVYDWYRKFPELPDWERTPLGFAFQTNRFPDDPIYRFIADLDTR